MCWVFGPIDIDSILDLIKFYLYIFGIIGKNKNNYNFENDLINVEFVKGV